MSKFKRYNDEFFKFLIVLHIAGKAQSDLCRDYDVSGSEVKFEDNLALTAKQIRELQKRILNRIISSKKTSTIFMQNSKAV